MGRTQKSIRPLTQRLDHTPNLLTKMELGQQTDSGSDDSTCSLLVVRQVPLLTSGGLSTVLATGQPVILIGVDQPHSEKLVCLWHEVVHLLREAGGYDQDEDDVEAAAQRLAAACPEALEWVGIREANDRTLATQPAPKDSDSK